MHEISRRLWYPAGKKRPRKGFRNGALLQILPYSEDASRRMLSPFSFSHENSLTSSFAEMGVFWSIRPEAKASVPMRVSGVIR